MSARPAASLAFREAARRPGQTVVLILGLMIAGAAIFSIQVIEDTMYESYRAHALQSWGRDDIEISANGEVRLGRLASYVRDRRIPLERLRSLSRQRQAEKVSLGSSVRSVGSTAPLNSDLRPFAKVIGTCSECACGMPAKLSPS